jgi:ParB-like chromosome segregation protein Spo0J
VDIDYHVEHVPLADIVVRSEHEPLQEDAVKRLMDSLYLTPLLHPIAVRWIEGTPHLVAGRHRLEALTRLGHFTIPTFEVEGDDLETELAMLDENVRKKVDPLAESFATKRRSELLRLIEGPRSHEEMAEDEKRRDSESRIFMQAEAERLGVALRTIQKRMRRADTLTPAAVKAIRANPAVLDHDRVLDSICHQPTEEGQLEVIQYHLDKAGAKEARKPTPAQRFVRRFEELSPETQTEVVRQLMGTAAGQSWIREATPYFVEAIEEAGCRRGAA